MNTREKAGISALFFLAIVVLFLSAVSAGAQIVFDAASSTSCSACTSLNWSHTVGAGSNRLLVVGVTEKVGSPFPSVIAVTYGGQPLTRQIVSGGGDPVSEIWTLVAPPPGTASVIVFHSGAAMAAGSVSFFGVDQAAPVRAGNQARAQGTTPTASVSTTVTTNLGDVVIDALAKEAVPSGGVTKFGPGQTLRWLKADPSGALAGSGMTKSADPGSTTMSYSFDTFIGFPPSAISAALSAITLIPAQADLAISKAGPDLVNIGDNITYTLNFTNNGPLDASGVTVTDAVPTGTTFVSASVTSGSGWVVTAPAAGSTGNVVFSKSTVVSGETAAFQIVVKVDSVGTPVKIVNTANAATTTPDFTTGNNSATVTTSVRQLIPMLSPLMLLLLAAGMTFIAATRLTD
jgi:uncharacterized repeat protein (TIGR01451 family)